MQARYPSTSTIAPRLPLPRIRPQPLAQALPVCLCQQLFAPGRVLPFKLRPPAFQARPFATDSG